MYGKYLQKLNLVSMKDDVNYTVGVTQSFYQSMYPFNLFPDKGMQEIEFAPITFFYGGNGSGKTTLLNILAEKLELKRHSLFSGSSLFSDYVKMCRVQTTTVPENSQILTSDDVFDFLLDSRSVNDGINDRRAELIQEYLDNKYAKHQLRSMDEFEEWRKTREAKSKTQSKYVRSRLMGNVNMRSNGESAMGFFAEHIDENALYLLDEPENSLSIVFQQELKKLILDAARYLGCQFVIASHSPVLLSIPDAVIYDLDDDPVRIKKWTELENVRKYFEFFEAHRQEFLTNDEPNGGDSYEA